MSATRHPEVERLSAWASGDLNDRDAAAVRAHVAGCPACADVVADLGAQVTAARGLDRPEPPPTLWAAIDGTLARLEETPRARWSWRPLLLGGFAGATLITLIAAGVMLWQVTTPTGSAVWTRLTGGHAVPSTAGQGGPVTGAAGAEGGAEVGRVGTGVTDPLLAEAERELARAVAAYEASANRLRAILDREQTRWDPVARARLGDRLARLDAAVAESRAVVARDPSDGAGAELLFSAFQRQIDFLAEAVHRGAPQVGVGAGKGEEAWP